MTLSAHKTRKVWPPDLYAKPDQPHHVHLANGCVDHRIESCPDEHWIGEHPDPGFPHHVEFDGKTGQWGYTRLTDEEIADLVVLQDFLREQAEAEEAR